MSTPKLPVVRGKGRPSYGDPVRTAIVNNLKMGCTRTAAYGAAGVSEPTFYRWLTEIDGFRESVEQAEAHAEKLYTGRLAIRARAGDTRAIAFWLERRRSKEWRERTSIDVGEREIEEELEQAIDDSVRRERLQALADEAHRRAASGADGEPDLDGSDDQESDGSP